MVGFTQSAAERIKAAVLSYEKANQGITPQHKRLGQISPVGFWAKITGKSGKKYSWIALEPKDDDTLDDQEDWGEGTTSEQYAVEVTGSEWVLTDDVVWLMPSKNQDYYLFHYAPGVKMAVFSSTIPSGNSTTPGSATVTIRKFSSGSFSNGATVTAYNPWSITLDSDNTPNSRIMISYGDGVWWVSGANCEEET